ncbi:uncharacterized protein LOC143288856 [Babylonia areolata]|uniref:uncharacterized protein LOC143288856 n=1 Tax=Babylonia areolata TaxID=304850 RepID=UPI003FD1F037
MERRGRKRKLTTKNRKKMRRAFSSLPYDHPFWENVLPYLSTRDKISLRGVNRNCQDIVDSSFSKALSLTVPSDMPPRLVRIMVGKNKCVRTLKAQHYKTMDDIAPCFKYQVRLASVDLSHSVFTNVKLAFDTLVNHCRLLKKIRLQNLSENEHPLAARSEYWPFRRLLRKPLPHLQHLDISGNGSRKLSTAMFISLMKKHPKLHTLSVDSGVIAGVISDASQDRSVRTRMNHEGGLEKMDLMFRHAVGHLLRKRKSLVRILETWLASPGLKNLTLCLGGLNAVQELLWFLSVSKRKLPQRYRKLPLIDPSPRRRIQCTKKPVTEGDVSSPPQPEISYQFAEGFRTVLRSFRERGVIVKAARNW